jgi:hypothetical protein
MFLANRLADLAGTVISMEFECIDETCTPLVDLGLETIADEPSSPLSLLIKTMHIRKNL